MSSTLERLRELRERRERVAAEAKAAAAVAGTEEAKAERVVPASGGSGPPPTEGSHAHTGAGAGGPQPPRSLMSPSSVPPSFASPAGAVLQYRNADTDVLVGVVTARAVAAAVSAALLAATTATAAAASEEEEGSSGEASEPSGKRSREDDGCSAAPSLAEDLRSSIAAVLSEWSRSPHGEETTEPDESPACRIRRAYLDVSGSPVPRCRDVNGYLRKDCIAQGVYGVVFSAKEAATGQLYALKHIKKQWLEESQIGFPPYLLREFDLLRRLKHPNVVAATELVVLDPDLLPGETRAAGEVEGTRSPDNHEESSSRPLSTVPPTASLLKRSGAKDVFLVMEYCPFDLKNYMLRYSSSSPHQPYLHVTSRSRGAADVEANFLSRVKCIAVQLFRGLAFLHANRILHRDVKTSNVLLSDKGIVKLCDFGLGRHYREGQALTPTVVTLMYRAPELHFGLTDYSHKMDVWSMGCVMAELFLKTPLFRAADETRHLLAVCDLLGIPSEETFPGLYKLPRAKEALRALGQWNRVNRLAEAFYGPSEPGNAEHPPCHDGSSTGGGDRGGGEREGARRVLCYDAHLLPKSGLDLFQRIFSWNPANRPSAADVLAHPFFSEEPLPCAPEELTRPMPSGGKGLPPPPPPPPPPLRPPPPLAPDARGSGSSVPPPLVHVKDTADTSPRGPTGASESEEEEERQGTASPTSNSNTGEEGSLTYSNTMSPAGGGGHAAAATRSTARGSAGDDGDVPAQDGEEAEWQAQQRAQIMANPDLEG